MSSHKETFVDTPAGKVRIWEKGSGKKVGYFAGVGGLTKWPAFLDELSKTHHVLAPSLPGFPGGPGSENIDSFYDWVLAAGDVFDAADLRGHALIGSSIGGALALEVAATWPNAVPKLALIAPYGMFDEAAPVADIFAQQPNMMANILVQDPAVLTAHWSAPEGADRGNWEIAQLRANVAAAAIMWPLGDTRVARRLGRIRAETLILWGEKDRVIPPAYAEKLAAGIAGKSTSQTIAGAGHLAEIDQPVAVAKAVAAFLG